MFPQPDEDMAKIERSLVWHDTNASPQSQDERQILGKECKNWPKTQTYGAPVTDTWMQFNSPPLHPVVVLNLNNEQTLFSMT